MAEWTLTEAQNGSRIDVRVGDAIVVMLSGSGGAYHWSPVSVDDTYLTVERLSYEPAPGDSSDVFRLVARQPGHTRLELSKSRQWESTAIAHFAVDVEIRAR